MLEAPFQFEAPYSRFRSGHRGAGKHSFDVGSRAMQESSIDLGYLFEERVQYSIHKLRAFGEVGLGSFGLRR